MITQIISDDIDRLDPKPKYYHGPGSFQNVKADKEDSTNFIIYLDQPIMSNDKILTSGYIEETYHIRVIIAKKSSIKYTTEQHQAIIDGARLVKQKFLNALNTDSKIKSINNIQTMEVYNVFDLNMTGIYLKVDVIPKNDLSNCIP